MSWLCSGEQQPAALLGAAAEGCATQPLPVRSVAEPSKEPKRACEAKGSWASGWICGNLLLKILTSRLDCWYYAMRNIKLKNS